jgi:hypothetical protein
MHTPHYVFLALASWLTAVSGRDVPFSYDDAFGVAENDLVGTLAEPEPWRGNPTKTVSARYPLPGPQCSTWVGVETIFMVEATEVCPEGSTGKVPGPLFRGMYLS